MDVDPRTAQHATQHDGKTYYFCAPGCRRAFEKDPARYLDPSHKPSM
ncbi:MAG: YHS domain-containing protein [Chloroflexi bacterium]|nr:YHS domain-containing protein [Chloroflexota bacterium]